MIAAKDAVIAAKDAVKDAVVVTSDMVPLSEFVRHPLRIHNHTDSSAHTDTNYPAAEYTELETLPDLQMDASFGEKLIRFSILAIVRSTLNPMLLCSMWSCS